jgi:hypothetical protein
MPSPTTPAPVSPDVATGDNSEAVHFPWAHVEDFRHFFGLDKLMEYSQHKKAAIYTRITHMLSISTKNKRIRDSINSVAARAIVIGHYLETFIEVQGEYPWYAHLENAITIDHPELALHQRLSTLAEYLYENEIIDSFNLEDAMHLNRLTGLMVLHAAEFWEDAHMELFMLTSRLDNALQIRYLSSNILKQLPRTEITQEQAQRFVDLFKAWPREMEQSLQEAQEMLKNTSAANPRRANLRKIASSLQVLAYA